LAHFQLPSFPTRRSADLPIPISRAYDINDAGMVAGESWRDGQNFHAVIWQPDGTIVDLGEPGTESVARAISPAGGVVAGSFGGGGRKSTRLNSSHVKISY